MKTEVEMSNEIIAEVIAEEAELKAIFKRFKDAQDELDEVEKFLQTNYMPVLKRLVDAGEMEVAKRYIVTNFPPGSVTWCFAQDCWRPGVRRAKNSSFRRNFTPARRCLKMMSGLGCCVWGGEG